MIDALILINIKNFFSFLTFVKLFQSIYMYKIYN